MNPQEIVWEIRQVTTFKEDWMLILMLLALIILVAVRLKNNDVYRDLISAVFGSKLMTKASLTQVGWTDSEKVLLLVVYFIVAPLFFALVFAGVFPSLTGQTSLVAFFGLFLIILLLAFGLRLVVLWLIERVLGKTDLITEYSFSIGQTNRILGLLLMPMVIMLLIVPKKEATGIVYLGLAMYAGIYLIRMMRMVINSLKIPHGFFYIILYFCTLEILPFLLVYHYAKMMVGR